MKNKEYYESLDRNSQEYIEYEKFNRIGNNPNGISFETFKRDLQDLRIK
jgi:hypothetical protein